MFRHLLGRLPISDLLQYTAEISREEELKLVARLRRDKLDLFHPDTLITVRFTPFGNLTDKCLESEMVCIRLAIQQQGHGTS